MQYAYFIISAVAFSFVIFGLIFKTKNKAKLLNFTKIKKVSKPQNFNLYLGVFKGEKYTLFSFENNIFRLSLNGKEVLNLRVFVDDLEFCTKIDILQDVAVFGLNENKLCVKSKNLEVLCNKHNIIRFEIDKGKIPFSLSNKKDVVKFEDFKFVFTSDGKMKVKNLNDILIYEFTNTSQILLDFESLNLKIISLREIKKFTAKNFGMPRLDFAKPDFSKIRQNCPQGIYAKECLEKAKFFITDAPKGCMLNLSELGFSKWIVASKWRDVITLTDWKTNYVLKIKSKGKFFLSVWWGEIFLCLDNSNYSFKKLPFDEIKKGNINLFKLKLNWQEFPENLRFIFAYGMLKYMNKNDDSKYLKSKDIATFVFDCLPKNLQNKKEHYLYAREISPFVKHKMLKKELLIFMQKYEQKFYKNEIL